MLVSGLLLESLLAAQVVASLHGLAIVGSLALLAYLVLRRSPAGPEEQVPSPADSVLRKEHR